MQQQESGGSRKWASLTSKSVEAARTAGETWSTDVWDWTGAEVPADVEAMTASLPKKAK
jgi:hypothetical protein